MSQSDVFQTLQLVEKIDICLPYEMPFAKISNVGKCLQTWQLGVYEKNTSPETPHVEISTNKHDYIFAVNSNRLYCRAARIRHSNQGTVFAQNIRIWISSGQKNVSMEDNNLIICAVDVEIDNSMFNPNICTSDEVGFYWSLISCKPKIIKLNGCDGQVYRYGRSKIFKKIVEWFAYKNY